MAATSSIHPLNRREPCAPFETEPLIGSESTSIELAATGARPRREALLSGPASLTPSER
jgi:hypothetical protein